MDITRILMKNPQLLESTDISSSSLKILKEENKIKVINIVGRRGPIQAAMTSKELRELIKLKGVSRKIEDGVIMTSESDQEEFKDRQKFRVFQLLNNILVFQNTQKEEKQIKFHFLKSPVEIIESSDKPGHVSAVKFECTMLTGPPNNQVPKGTGYFITIPTDIVFRSIGYYSPSINGLPFDKIKGKIENIDGKVQKGVYACGWLKRGPSGIIGTNKFDSEQVISTLIKDFECGEILSNKTISGDNIPEYPQDILRSIFHKKEISPVSFSDWKIIDEEEKSRGLSLNKLREKMTSVQEMFDFIRSK